MEAMLKFYMRKISTWGYVSEPLTPLIYVMGFDTLLPAFRVFRLAVLPPLSFGLFPRERGKPGTGPPWAYLESGCGIITFNHTVTDFHVERSV